MAITWSTVTAPSQTSALGFAELGANQIQQGIAGLVDLASNIAQKEIEDRQRVKDINNETVLNVINSIGNEDDLTNAKSQLTLDNLNKLYGNQINAGSILSALHDKQKSLRQDALSAQQFEINTNELNEQRIQQQDTALISQAKQLAAAGKFDAAFALSSQTSDPALITNAVNAVKYQPVYTNIESALSVGDFKTAGQLIKDNPDLPNALKYAQIISSQSNEAFDRSMSSAKLSLEQQKFAIQKKAAEQREKEMLEARARNSKVSLAIENVNSNNYREIVSELISGMSATDASAQEILGAVDAVGLAFNKKTGGDPSTVRNVQAAVKVQSDELAREIKELEAKRDAYEQNNKYSRVNITARLTETKTNLYGDIKMYAPSETITGGVPLDKVGKTFFNGDIGGVDLVRLSDQLLTTKVVAVTDANGKVTIRAALPTDAKEAQYPIDVWMLRDALQVARDSGDPYTDGEIRPEAYVEHAFMLAVEAGQQSKLADAELERQNKNIREKQLELSKLQAGSKDLQDLLQQTIKGNSREDPTGLTDTIKKLNGSF